MDRRHFSLSLLASMATAPALTVAPSQHSGIQEDDCELVFPADRFRSLCGFIDSQVTEPEGSIDFYSYQRKAYDVGKVTLRDSATSTRKKVQHLFVLNQSIMDCDALSFSVSNGSMLKLAVARKFDDFIQEAVVDWRVPLNRVDQSDGRTVLDFINDELARASGTPLEGKLRYYQQTFRAAGARTARELAVTPDVYIDPYEHEIQPLRATWEKACYISEDRQAVKRDGLWGYLNEEGQLAIGLRFQAGFSFSEGRAPVAVEGLWGFINPAGTLVVPARYRDVRAFRDGQADVSVDGRTWTQISLNP